MESVNPINNLTIQHMLLLLDINNISAIRIFYIGIEFCEDLYLRFFFIIVKNAK